MSNYTLFEKRLMSKIISQSLRYKGKTFPNPIVGAAVYKGDTVIATGYHLGYGLDHAEVVALKKAGAAARGASMMVSLSPCTHYGQTPPCVDAIIAAGISKITFPIIDPHPATKRLPVTTLLKKAGIQVKIGLCKEKALQTNGGYFSAIINKKPFVHLKVGMSLDGIIAEKNNPRRYITSTEALKRVHRLRRTVQAIIVGVGTILADNPKLDVRYKLLRNGYHLPKRVILDPTGKTPLSSQVLASRHASETIICTSSRCPADKLTQLQKVATIWELPETPYGLDWHALLQKLGALNLQDVLIEGGQHVFSSALCEKIVDWGHFFIAPNILGREANLSAFNLPKSHPNISLPDFYNFQYHMCGADLYMTGPLHCQKLKI